MVTGMVLSVCQCPSDFKDAVFLEIKYFKNKARQCHSYYWTLIKSHIQYGMVSFPITWNDH